MVRLLRDAVLTKRCGKASEEIAILKQFPTHFEAKCEKGVGTPFPRVPAPLHTCIYSINQYRVVHKNAID